MSTPHDTRPLPPAPWNRSGSTGAPGDDAHHPPADAGPAHGPATGPGATAAGPGAPRSGFREWGPWSPRTLFFGSTDLVVDAALGTLWLTALFSLLAAAIASLPVLVGVVLLVAAVYAVRGIEWIERRRTQAAFGLHLPAPHRRRSPRPDGWRHLHQLWLDVSDGAFWTGLLHLALTTALGWVAVGALAGTGAAVALAFAPLYAAENNPVWPSEVLGTWPAWAVVLTGITLALLGLLVALLCTAAHRGLSRLLLRVDEASELRRRAAAAAAARETAVRGARTERSRIERDLHDGVQPQLVAVAMNLSMAQRRIDDDPAAAKELIGEAHATTKAAITGLRRLARGFHPAVLEDRGLDAALSAVAAQSPVPVAVDVQVPRLAPETEAAVYFAVAEGLGNVVKHAGASAASVRVVLEHDAATGAPRVVARIADDGRGGAVVVPGGGLSGIADRIRSAGGRFLLDSPAGGPTELTVELPVAPGGAF
ncbi:sensor histidine kinase [Kocuria rosea]|uniref:sensor histidine kinase n=1 Tax=Kocuria rosea TaxID=1275 RepID=UPI002041FBEB|nr:sensor domain-containing protein [Kocuria rosea]MCM3686942.1 sensor domain-containing protein [Kocuria rosea]